MDDFGLGFGSESEEPEPQPSNIPLKAIDTVLQVHVPPRELVNLIFSYVSRNVIVKWAGTGSNNRADRTMIVYDPLNNNWNEEPERMSYPQPVVWPAGCIVNNRFLFTCGGGINGVPTRLCYYMDMDSKDSKWIAIPPTNENHYGHSLIFVKGQLIIFGRLGIERFLVDVNGLKSDEKVEGRWDTIVSHNHSQEFLRVHKVRLARYLAGCVTFDNRVHIIGGYTDTRQKIAIKECMSYSFEGTNDLKSVTCEIPNLPHPLFHFGCCMHGTRIVIIGGRNHYNMFAQCYYFDTAELKGSAKATDFRWNNLPNLKEPIAGGHAIIVDGILFSIGGYQFTRTNNSDEVGTPQNRIEYYDEELSQWTPAQPFRSYRDDCACVVRDVPFSG
jgi:hypothetical protein